MECWRRANANPVLVTLSTPALLVNIRLSPKAPADCLSRLLALELTLSLEEDRYLGISDSTREGEGELRLFTDPTLPSTGATSGFGLRGSCALVTISMSSSRSTSLLSAAFCVFASVAVAIGGGGGMRFFVRFPDLTALLMVLPVPVPVPVVVVAFCKIGSDDVDGDLRRCTDSTCSVRLNPPVEVSAAVVACVLTIEA